MTRSEKIRRRVVRDPAYRSVLRRLEESLDQNADLSHAEMIEVMGRHMFGDLWRPQEQLGAGLLPK